MKINFFYIGGESLAIELLSAVLKEHGFHTSLTFDPGLFDDKQYLKIPILRNIFKKTKKLIEATIDNEPNLIAFSVVTDMYDWACQIASEIKKRKNIPIIFGGIHVSSVPEEVISQDYIDMICIGEGEDALLELVQNLNNKEKRTDIRNIWFKDKGKIIKNFPRPLRDDLDSLPLPDKELFAEEANLKNGRYMVMTSRGCPHSCTYCYNDVLKKIYKNESKFFRQRSVQNVIRELEIMKQRLRFKSVEFMDDLFAGNINWLSKFINEYSKRINVPYQCMSDSNVITYQKAELLKKSGCTRIKFGIQTANSHTREKILNRYFEKQDKIEGVFKICDEVGLDYSIDHIFGIPYETESDYRSTALFYTQTKARRVNCYSLAYFPQTKISEIAFQANKITKQQLDLINKGKDKIYVMGSSLSRDELKLYRCYRNYYSLLPLVNRNWMIKILNSKNFKLLMHIPQSIVLFLEFLASIKSGHLRGIDFFRYYLRHIVRIQK